MKSLKFLIKNPSFFIIAPLLRVPYFHFLRGTSSTSNPITFRIWFMQKVMGFNRQAYWPMHFTSHVVGVDNITIGIGSNPGYNPGIYIQGTGSLILGDYVMVGQNSGILSGGHDVNDHNKLTPSETTIGNYCWIGMNSTILPGVKLGDHTKVGAGSVVTKSFEEGYCIIAGNPAKVIRRLIPTDVKEYRFKEEYIGYYRKRDWAKTHEKI